MLAASEEREYGVDVFRKGKFELLAITGTNLKGNEEVLRCGVNGIIAILLNNVWHSAMVEFGYVSSRTLWIKFKFLSVKVCMVVGYGPKRMMMKKGKSCGMT